MFGASAELASVMEFGFSYARAAAGGVVCCAVRDLEVFHEHGYDDVDEDELGDEHEHDEEHWRHHATERENTTTRLTQQL